MCAAGLSNSQMYRDRDSVATSIVDLVGDDPVRLARVLDQLPRVPALKAAGKVLLQGGFPGESTRNRVQIAINKNAGEQLQGMATSRIGEHIGAAPKYGATLLHSIPSGLLCEAARCLQLTWQDKKKPSGDCVHVSSVVRATQTFIETVLMPQDLLRELGSVISLRCGGMSSVSILQ
jgi:hypothetical protein